MRERVGSIEVITGVMFAGKSEELIRRANRLAYGGQVSANFKCATDTRSKSGFIQTKSGQELRATDIHPNSPEMLTWELNELEKAHKRKYDVVVLDEAQFFPRDSPMLGIIMDLANSGYRVIVAGLDLDYKAEPFGMMPQVLALADEITKLKAVCECGSHDARFPQRFLGGQLAGEGPQIMVGGAETYKARCRQCYIHPSKVTNDQLEVALVS